MSSRIDFIQITDLHLDDPPTTLKSGRNTTENLLKQVLSNIAFDETEFFICTGDLAATPSIPAYKRLISIFKHIPLPIYCLPGNHDDPSLAVKSTQVSNLSWNKSITQKPWQIILLNSHQPNEVYGQLGYSELTFLQTCLQQHSSLHTLICLHHQPVSIGSEWLDQHLIKDQQAFFNIIDKHPQVRGIIWGHIHQAFETRRDGIRLLGTPSTCTQFKPNSPHFAVDTLPPAYRRISLHLDGEITTNVVWCKN